MDEGESFAHVCWRWNDFRLIWIVAQLLIDTLWAHVQVLNPCVRHRIPHKCTHSLRKHVRHEFKLFTELQTALEGLFLEDTFAALDQALRTAYLHVEVVGVERLEKRQDVWENGLRVAVVDDLLLSHLELWVEEVLVGCGCLLEVLLSESSNGQVLNSAEKRQEVFTDDFFKSSLGACAEQSRLFELWNGKDAVKELRESDSFDHVDLLSEHFLDQDWDVIHLDRGVSRHYHGILEKSLTPDLRYENFASLLAEFAIVEEYFSQASLCLYHPSVNLWFLDWVFHWSSLGTWFWSFRLDLFWFELWRKQLFSKSLNFEIRLLIEVIRRKYWFDWVALLGVGQKLCVDVFTLSSFVVTTRACFRKFTFVEEIISEKVLSITVLWALLNVRNNFFGIFSIPHCCRRRFRNCFYFFIEKLLL